MRPLLLLVLTALAQAPTPGAPGGMAEIGAGMGLAEAQRRVRAGQHLIALAAADAWLESEPGSLLARAIRVEALAAQGRCHDAGLGLRTLRPTAVWSARLAVLEGDCALTARDHATAAAAFDEALQMSPSAVGALHGRARVLGELGEMQAMENALEELSDREDAGRRADVLRAQIALEAGAPEIDTLLVELARAAEHGSRVQTRQHVLVLEGRRWLDLSDPLAAETCFSEAAPLLPGRVFAGVYRAEALRRLGQAAGSEIILSQKRISSRPTAHARAVRVRVLVDLGRWAEARAALAALPDPETVDALASAWYLARAEGRTRVAADLADRWRESVPNPIRSLEQLVPISETP